MKFIYILGLIIMTIGFARMYRNTPECSEGLSKLDTKSQFLFLTVICILILLWPISFTAALLIGNDKKEEE